ncbi:hypothetical protein E8E01_19335 [Methylorubrum populi]|uniref:hypothetical protein n=1 Tax=Methylorubrum populi TaxID=223967 RepID=UPI0011514B27|nr:hypothetical protein [Methylorubrum populi]QDI82417.1 hypothetical protein E8E01_19335 [Methylorubrum populi]
MTLDELNEARELATRRAELLQEADDVEKRGAEAAHLFGHKFNLEMEDVLRMALAGELRRRAGVSEARLRELGIVFPGDPVAEIDPGPKHAFIQRNSWNRETGEFTVWVPCTPARSWRRAEALGEADVEVDEALNPHGIEPDSLGAVTVVDATDRNAEWRECAKVVGTTSTDQGVAIRVRVFSYNGLVRGAVAAGDISAVGIGYEGLEETIVEGTGDRPLVNVHRWRLHELRLHRADTLAEAA